MLFLTSICLYHRTSQSYMSKLKMLLTCVTKKNSVNITHDNTPHISRLKKLPSQLMTEVKLNHHVTSITSVTELTTRENLRQPLAVWVFHGCFVYKRWAVACDLGISPEILCVDDGLGGRGNNNYRIRSILILRIEHQMFI